MNKKTLEIKNSLRELIKSAILECKREDHGDIRNEFRELVSQIITEVKNDSKLVKDPTPPTDYKDVETNKYQRDVTTDTGESSSKLVNDVKNALKKVNPEVTVQLDDHNDVTAILPGVFKIRISAKWSGVFNVEAYKNMTDRVYAIGLNYQQVLDFVKVNFSTKKRAGYVQTAYDTGTAGQKDNSEKRDSSIPKGEPIDKKEVPSKDIEKNDDAPGAPMEPVKDKALDQNKDVTTKKPDAMKKAQTMSKKNVDDDLTKSWKK